MSNSEEAAKRKLMEAVQKDIGAVIAFVLTASMFVASCLVLLHIMRIVGLSQ